MNLVGDEGRETARTNLCLSAIVRWEDRSAPVRIRDLSATGVRLEGYVLPELGEAMMVSRGHLGAGGNIVWCEPGRCGVRFDAPIMVKDWLPGRSGLAQQNVDRMVAEVRSEPKPLPPGCTTSAPPDDFRLVLPARLAEEISYVMRLLESLGDDLANEPIVLARHAAKLQNLDISAQVLGHIANLMSASDPESAVASIGMDALRRRLLRQPL